MEKKIMKKSYFLCLIFILIIFSVGCATSYKARPLSFKYPSAYPNATQQMTPTLRFKVINGRNL